MRTYSWVHLQSHLHFSAYSELLLESQQDYQVDLAGSARRNHQWQANQQKGFDADHFLIDWQQQQATCPEGHTSSSWTPAIDNRTNEIIKMKFSTKDCQACPSLRLCTQSIRHGRRTVTIRPKEQYDALQARRKLEAAQDFKTLSVRRAGVEGATSQGVRTMGVAARAPLGKNARLYTIWPQRQPSMSFVSCIG